MEGSIHSNQILSQIHEFREAGAKLTKFSAQMIKKIQRYGFGEIIRSVSNRTSGFSRIFVHTIKLGDMKYLQLSDCDLLIEDIQKLTVIHGDLRRCTCATCRVGITSWRASCRCPEVLLKWSVISLISVGRMTTYLQKTPKFIYIYICIHTLYIYTYTYIYTLYDIWYIWGWQ